jgi:GAF domain-containing protein
MLCKDALADSRIRFSIAQHLHLRSVVAVPIRAQGSVLGLLEVFSFRPFAFDTVHADTLQAVANLLVRVVLASVRNGLPPANLSM